ncbi:MAG: hypothetical protein LBM98_06520 [Oscillospiraceae bacterium]|nr:hypothetical protein [Oscillospiraceae bacterium]
MPRCMFSLPVLRNDGRGKPRPYRHCAFTFTPRKPKGGFETRPYVF